MQMDQDHPFWPGVFGDTLLATPQGFCAAGKLTPGAEIITAGGDTVHIAAVQRRLVPRDLAWQQWPILLPADTFSTTAELVLPPGQPLFVPGGAIAEAVMQSHVLDGWNGITRAVPAPGATIINLFFTRAIAVQTHQNLWLAFPDSAGAYTPAFLSVQAAKERLARMMAAQLGRALVSARSEDQAATRAPPPKRV